MEKLRQEDREEWAAGGWVPMEPYLGHALSLSEACLDGRTFTRIAFRDQEPMLLYGVMPHAEDATIGVVWMVAHQDAPGVQKELHKACMGELSEMLKLYRKLHADVYSGNGEHVRWLHTMGFVPNLPYKRPPYGCWFIPMERGQNG